MMEVGPWRWDGTSFKVKEGGWEEYATIVYGECSTNHRRRLSNVSLVDQPPGTGFSYTSTDHYLHTMDDVCATICWVTPASNHPLRQSHILWNF